MHPHADLMSRGLLRWHNPANSADFARSQELPGSTRLRGGPERIRTSNQTIISGR